MNGQKRVFVVDVDNTLIDTEAIRDFIKANPAMPVPFKRYLFKDAEKTLKRLQKLGRVIIFSLGDNAYQRQKIRKSGIAEIVGRKNVLITDDKFRQAEKLIRALSDQGFNGLTFIDDRADVLEEVKKINPEIITCWIKYGKYKKVLPQNTRTINFESENLEGVLQFLSSFEAVFKSEIGPLSILNTITRGQIKQLIKYSKTDLMVKKYTHDSTRFKDQEAVSMWLKQDKKVYVLTNRKGKLLGIIWFSKKECPAEPLYRDSLAIRLYGGARGKKLSEKFMRVCLNKFKKKRIWLSTKSNNKAAIVLYKKFGFVARGKINGRLIMTLSS